MRSPTSVQWTHKIVRLKCAIEFALRKHYWVYGRSIRQENCASTVEIVTERFVPTDTATLQTDWV